MTHISRGLIFTRMNRLDDAIKSFHHALAMDSNHAETLINLGTVYYYQKKYDSAELCLRQAIRSNPMEANAYNVLALLKLDLGNTDEALLRVNHALSLKKNDPYFLNNRGLIFITKNNFEKALEDIDKSIGEDPYNAWAYRNKGIYYLRTKNIESAIRLLTKAAEMDTTVTKVFYYLGEANILKGDAKIGCAYLRRSLARAEITEAELKLKCRN